MQYPIPKNSAAAWRKYQTRSLQNPGLIFDRFAPDWSQDSTLKKGGLEAVREAAAKSDVPLLKAWNARWEAAVRAAHAEPFPLTTDWRFVAGLGRKGSLEVGFTFHRYGFPILPGSSVKGIARAYGLFALAETLGAKRLDELDEILSKDKLEEYERDFARCYSGASAEIAGRFRALFGTTGEAGLAVFFDAIPARVPKLELDIMNPHYPKYYEGSAPPTDWQNPVPVYFLTVAPHTEFRFAVGWRVSPAAADALQLRDLAKEWLTAGLTKLGAGAKTSAGYGYFVL